LLVEDEASVRAVIRTILSRYGYEVLEARGGEEALRRSQERDGKIDLLLTDVVMPHMSGPQVVQMLRPLRPDMKALFMSGYTDSSIAKHAIAELGVDLIQKPVTPEALARKIRDVLDTP
jgi:CheY-like chemotaxis protein